MRGRGGPSREQHGRQRLDQSRERVRVKRRYNSGVNPSGPASAGPSCGAAGDSEDHGLLRGQRPATSLAGLGVWRSKGRRTSWQCKTNARTTEERVFASSQLFSCAASHRPGAGAVLIGPGPAAPTRSVPASHARLSARISSSSDFLAIARLPSSERLREIFVDGT